MEQEVFSIGSTYLRIESVFDSLTAYGKEIGTPEFWEDDGQVIVWGYRISGSEVSHHSQIDYIHNNELEFIHLCQYVCNRMVDLLDNCIAKIQKHDSNPEKQHIKLADSSFRIYHSCDYLSLEEEEELSRKLNQLSRSGKLKEMNCKGGLSEKVAQIKDVDFSTGANSKTLISRLNQEKVKFSQEIRQHTLKTYQDYLLYRQKRRNNFNQLDDLIL